MLGLRKARHTKKEAGGFQDKMLPGLQEFAHAVLSTTLELFQNCFMRLHTEISAHTKVLRMSFIEEEKYKRLCSVLFSAHFVPCSLSNQIFHAKKKKKE